MIIREQSARLLKRCLADSGLNDFSKLMVARMVLAFILHRKDRHTGEGCPVRLPRVLLLPNRSTGDSSRDFWHVRAGRRMTSTPRHVRLCCEQKTARADFCLLSTPRCFLRPGRKHKMSTAQAIANVGPGKVAATIKGSSTARVSIVLRLVC